MIEGLGIIAFAVAAALFGYATGRLHGRRQSCGLRWNGHALVTDQRLDDADRAALQAAWQAFPCGVAASRK